MACRGGGTCQAARGSGTCLGHHDGCAAQHKYASVSPTASFFLLVGRKARRFLYCKF